MGVLAGLHHELLVSITTCLVWMIISYFCGSYDKELFLSWKFFVKHATVADNEHHSAACYGTDIHEVRWYFV